MRVGRIAAVTGALALAFAGTAGAWGVEGHRIITSVAVAGLPADMPAFFAGAAHQLAFLGPEPDRWRDNELTAMDEAWKYDHYIDLENVPARALDAPDRYEYLEALYRAGLEEPEQRAGFLPYRIQELYQRLATGFARWRTAASDRERAWVEDRIITDAGILGHYVADAANPHHTTIHFNGWAGAAPNPEDYTTSRDFHWRFESRFVDAHVATKDVQAAVPVGAEVFADVAHAVRDYLMESHRQVVPLYELEKAYGFAADSCHPATEGFVVQRLAAGATMLRSLWYSAWVESESLADREGG